VQRQTRIAARKRAGVMFGLMIRALHPAARGRAFVDRLLVTASQAATREASGVDVGASLWASASDAAAANRLLSRDFGLKDVPTLQGPAVAGDSGALRGHEHVSDDM
jgi:hypothetical protein